MKTSTKQFYTLVEFMEKHGDIAVQWKGGHQRIQGWRKWDYLTQKLNSDPSGGAKSTEKWRKVWSDLKNNTKKKLKKINKIPDCGLKLSNCEKRVISLMETQSKSNSESTSASQILDNIEAGIIQEQNIMDVEDSNHGATLPLTPPLQLSPIPPVPQSPPRSPVLQNETIFTVEKVSNKVPAPSNQPGSTRQPHRPPSVASSVLSLSEDSQHGKQQARTQRGYTTQRRCGVTRTSRRTQSHTDGLNEIFKKSNIEWRNFLKKKHDDEMAIEREKLRLRELELKTQETWQDVCFHAINGIDKILNKLLN